MKRSLDKIIKSLYGKLLQSRYIVNGNILQRFGFKFSFLASPKRLIAS